MNKDEVQQYDYVRITEVRRNFRREECLPGTRIPEVGDTAAVIEIYDKPVLGYELESVDEDGQTNWLVTITPPDLEFERVTTGN